MTTFRSEGWTVRPSFVPNGATMPITLLGDEQGLTQLSGTPQVAWQTPWEELSSIQLLRFSRGLALFATADGVRYCWRSQSRADYDAVAAVVTAHGGRLIQRRRRFGVYAVVAIVILASLAGGIGALLSRGPSVNVELKGTKAANIALKDLPSNFDTTSTSVLGYVFGAANKVFKLNPSTTTTAPKPTSAWAQVSTQFQSCMGVPAKKDRVYGAAGQSPDYQVTSPVFASTTYGGVEVVTTSQYYNTAQMVKKDTKEMSSAKFGGCLVASNAALIMSAYTSKVPTIPPGANFKPTTFVHGWARGGVAAITEQGSAVKLSLVVVVATSGHYEVTVGALAVDWKKAKPLVDGLVNTVLSRITASTSTSA
jgi:hypothetical protein